MKLKWLGMAIIRIAEIVAGISMALWAGQKDVLLVVLAAVIFCDGLFNLFPAKKAGPDA